MCGLSITLALLTSRADLVTLFWDYPPEDLLTNNIVFRVRWTQTITQPLTNWTVSAVTTNLNLIRIDVPRGANFFSVTASNFWGESPFSDLASTPPVVKTNVTVTVTRP